MRRIQILSIFLFLVAVVTFGGYRVYTYRNTDRRGPKITMEEDSITVSIEDDDEMILDGITAEDDEDGDVTDSLIVESLSNFVDKKTRTATIVAFDSDNNVTKVSRTMVYSDYHAPRFSLSEPFKFPLETSDILVNLSAKDVLDGNITSQIKTSTDYTIDVDEVGEYAMEFSVTNSAGDTATLPATIEIYDTKEEANKPQIELSKYLVYTKKKEELDLWDYVESITMNNLEFVRDDEGVLRVSEDTYVSEDTDTSIYESEVTIEENIDYTTSGTYEVTYEIKDEDDEKGSIRLIVVVK
ncbi:MAG: hypothetical protein LUF92_13985 [Clostridiales bacterium]|nr:hypothetical protein [Clostridiales bacterium]